MKKIKKVFLLVLFMIVGMSFTSSVSKYPKGESILSGKLKLGTGLFSLNGKVKLFLETDYRLNIKSISIYGKLSLMSLKKTLKISDIKKDSINKLSLSSFMDTLLLITVDKNFDKNGGIINFEINTATGKTTESMHISKLIDNKYIAYKDSISSINRIEKLDIFLEGTIFSAREIKIKDYRIKTKNKTYTAIKN